MKAVNIEVKAKLNVDETTANGCLKLVEAYLNNHEEIRLIYDKRENGETELRYEPVI